MAQQNNAIIIGIDVCKDTLDIFEHESGRAYSIGNDATLIETWLDSKEGRLQLAIEPTNRYHEAVAEAAYARGHEVYLIDPYRLTHYRAGLGRRAKTDPEDAYLLARFLAREVGELRPWTPLTRGQQRFWQLLKRRSTLVRSKVQLRQSLADMGSLQKDADALLKQCVRMIAKLDRALLAQAKELGWSESIARCRAIPGIGPLTAMALVATWHRGAFSSVDAFVACSLSDAAGRLFYRMRDLGRGPRTAEHGTKLPEILVAIVLLVIHVDVCGQVRIVHRERTGRVVR